MLAPSAGATLRRGALAAVAAFCLAPASVLAQSAANSLPPRQLEPLPPAEVSVGEALGPARSNFANRGAFRAFIDGYILARMERARIAGVVVSVVKDGEVLMARGYGIAGIDPARERPRSDTLFRIGSISKTFIWTALMQLVEAGELSLDDPINDHLPAALRVPDQGFAQPILLRHLMTHTPGFEDSALGHLFRREPRNVLALDDYLAQYRPARVRPPGEVTAYSNYGAALAGRIVAEVSGQSFQAYVEDHILNPLAMTDTSFREPLVAVGPEARAMPADLAARVSAGLAWRDGRWRDDGFEYISQIAPAGAASSTAADMARYMLAHLGDGAYGGGRILRPETAKLMHERLFSNAPAVNGLAHGLMEFALPGGYRGYGHGGATLQFMSNMVMVPELGLGLFISANSGTGRPLVAAFPDAVVERFFTDGPAPAPRPPADFAERGRKFAGSYMSNRRPYTLLEKLILAPSGISRVSITDDGYLLRRDTEKTTRYVEVAPLVFREVGGVSTIAFAADGDGDITRLFPPQGIRAEDKIAFYQGPGWLALIGVLTAVLSISCLIDRRRRKRRGRPAGESEQERLAADVVAGLSAAWLLFAVLLVAALIQMTGQGNEVLYDFPSPLLIAALWPALFGGLGTLVAVATLYPVWREGHWSRRRRLGHSLMVAVSLLFTLTLQGWNLLGFHYF